MNGGGDLCLATLNGKLIKPQDVPSLNYPIYQYDSILEQEKLLKKTEQDSQGHGLGSLILMNLEVVLKIKKLMKHGIRM